VEAGPRARALPAPCEVGARLHALTVRARLPPTLVQQTLDVLGALGEVLVGVGVVAGHSVPAHTLASLYTAPRPCRVARAAGTAGLRQTNKDHH